MIQRLALLLCCGAFAVAAYVVLDAWQFEHLPTAKKLQRLWEDDMLHMSNTHQLPPAWKSVREIELTPGDEQARQWLRELQVPVTVHKDGQYKLQVMMVSWDDETKLGAYVQYDLMDLNSKNENTIWESNRTFILTDSNSWMSQWLKKSEALKTPPEAASKPVPASHPPQ